nr:IS4 family transposase [Acidiferrobacter thiooxydans]
MRYCDAIQVGDFQVATAGGVWVAVGVVKLGREVPHLPCDIFLDKEEWQVLVCVHTQKKIPPAQPPPIGEANRMVARLGGFMGRKSDGEPGTETMWRGLQRLDAMKDVWRLMGLDALTDSWRSMASGP